MQEDKIFSVRMRAAKNGAHEQGGKHISGGEMLSTYQDMKHAVNTLLEKALNHSKGNPDFMQIQFEAINEPIQQIEPLFVQTNEVGSVERGQIVAKGLLEQAGVPRSVIEKAYAQIPEYSGNRGAILFDICTGERIDNRGAKGVRVSRMDWKHANFEAWAKSQQMSANLRVKEALVLATKVSQHPATVAELCWSDDPDYQTGYVASKELGYQRITKLKEYGDENGCRIFFVEGLTDVSSYIYYLEKQPIFVQWGETDDTRFN